MGLSSTPYVDMPSLGSLYVVRSTNIVSIVCIRLGMFRRPVYTELYGGLVGGGDSVKAREIS